MTHLVPSVTFSKQIPTALSYKRLLSIYGEDMIYYLFLQVIIDSVF